MHGDLAQRVMLMELAVWGLLLNDAFDEAERAQKRSDHWQLQPRVPEGHPEGGRWTDGAIPVDRRVFVTAAVAAAIKLIDKIRQPLIRALTIVPIPLPFPMPPLLAADDHFRWEPSPRRPYMPYIEFDYYNQFTAALTTFGTAYHWHHIVEQRMANPQRPGGGLVFPPRSVHNSDNLILLPAKVHSCVTGYYVRKRTMPDGTFRTLRAFLDDKPWSQHYLIGVEYIRRCQRERIARSRRRAR